MYGHDAAPPDDSQFAEQLLAFDAALDDGERPGDTRSDDLPAALRDALSCLNMLERVRRGDHKEPGSGELPTQGPRRSPTDTAVSEPDHTTLDDQAPARLGRFEIVRILGQGGCGVVFLARDPLLNRLIALKIPRPERLLKPEMRQRFLREGRAAGCLDHPNLLPVFEAGEVGAVCYLASPYCPGISLSEWRRQHPIPVDPYSAARLIATLADAIHYAHQKGICHRDLKPSNILLESVVRGPSCVVKDSHCLSLTTDDGPRTTDFLPKIIDFGLAKMLDESCGDAVTGSGAVLGTPQYMAPEQAEGKTQAIGPATDIHALGLILYELLTGVAPYKGDTDLETLRRVIAVEPVRPGRLCRRLPRDLEAICLKCLAKEPQQRYASATALADDLRRFLNGHPTQARPLTAWQRSRKALRRRPRLIIAVCATVLALFALMGVGSYVASVHDSAAALSDRARQERERVAAEANAGRLRLYAREIAHLAELADEDRLTAGQLSAARPEELRGFEWHHLRRLADTDRAGSEWFVGRGHTQLVAKVAWSPDGRYCASASHDRTVIVWDLATQRPYWRLAGHKLPVNAVAFSPDGKTLACSASGPPFGAGGELKLWDLATGVERDSLVLPGDRLIDAVEFTPDGQTVAACGENRATGHAVVLWDLRTRRVRELGRAGEATWYPMLAVSPDGQTLAVACGQGHGPFPGNAAAPRSGAIQLFDIATGECTATLTGHAAVVQWVAFAPDGKTLVSADVDAIVKVWDVAARAARFSVRAGTHIALSPDGNTLATVQTPGDLLLWDTATGRRLARISSVPSQVHDLRFGPTGTQLAVACADRTVRVFDVRSIHDLPGHRPAEAWAVAFAPDGKSLATAGDDHAIRLWSVPDFKQKRVLRGHGSLVTSIAFSPDGRTLASGSFDHKVRLWDVATGQPQTVLEGHTQDLRVVAFSPDGRWLATAAKCVDEAVGELRLWDLSTGKVRTALAAQGNCLAFSGDGRLLAFRGAKDTVELLDVATLDPASVLRESTAVACVTFAPDGKTLATADTAGLLRFWDARTGSELSGPRAWAGCEVRALAFSPDGKTLASAGKGKTVRLWQAASRLELLRLKNLPDYVHALTFSPDSATLATACHDGTVRLYQGKSGR